MIGLTMEIIGILIMAILWYESPSLVKPRLGISKIYTERHMRKGGPKVCLEMSKL